MHFKSLTLITVFTIGHTLAQAAEPVGGTAAQDHLTLIEDAAPYPHLAKALEGTRDHDPERQFAQGIGALIDGLLGAARNQTDRPR